MGFYTNYNNGGSNTTNDIIPEGWYETIVTKAEIVTRNNGRQNIAFNFTIRNDVDQPQKNRIIFENMWKRKEPTEADKQTDDFSFGILMGLASKLNVSSNAYFETLQDLLNEFVGKCLLVQVRHSQYNGAKRADVDLVSGTRITNCPQCKHVFKAMPKKQPQQQAAKQPAPDSDGFVEIGTDFETPF